MARSTPVHSGYEIINGAGTGKNGDRIDVWIEYKTEEQSIDQNQSRVIAYFYAALRPGESSGTYGGSGCYSSFSVNGVSGTNLKSNGSYDFRTTTPNLLGTFDGWVDHNADGTKTIVLSGSFSTPSSWISGGNVTGNATLPTIPRATTPVVPGGIAINAEITIDLSSRASDSFTHTLKYQFYNEYGTIATKTAATSVTWHPGLELGEQIPNATSGLAIVTCETYLGDTLIGTKTVYTTLVLQGYVVPKINSIGIEMQSSNPVVAGWGIFVKGYSTAKFTVDAEGAYGSSIATYIFYLRKGAQTVYSVAQQSNEWVSPVLTEAADYTVIVTVIDSRGRDYTLQSAAFYVNDYGTPSVYGIDVFRCTSGGVKDIVGGTYISAKATFGYVSLGGRNSLTKKIEYRKIGAAGWTLGQNNPDSGVAYVFGGGGISVASTYEVAFTVQDAIASAVYIVRVLPVTASIHIRPGGKGVGIGGACDTDNEMQVYWDADFKGNIKINGVSLLDYFYPVGTIYYTSSWDNRPAVKFGGTWTQIKDRFILAAGDIWAAGTDGGSRYMQSHTHSVKIYNAAFPAQSTEENAPNYTYSNRWVYGSDTTGSGLGNAENMPPYYTAYCWRRTA